MEQKQSQEFAPMKESNSKSISVKRSGLHEDSPFGIVEVAVEGENTCFIALGETRISELQTREECEREIEEKDWRLITELMLSIIANGDEIIKFKKGGTDKMTVTE